METNEGSSQTIVALRDLIPCEQLAKTLLTFNQFYETVTMGRGTLLIDEDGTETSHPMIVLKLKGRKDNGRVDGESSNLYQGEDGDQ